MKKVFSCSEDEFLSHCESFDGICAKCGEWTDGGVEPDAEGYKCEACGAMAVMGAEHGILMGMFLMVSLL